MYMNGCFVFVIWVVKLSAWKARIWISGRKWSALISAFDRFYFAFSFRINELKLFRERNLNLALDRVLSHLFLDVCSSFDFFSFSVDCFIAKHSGSVWLCFKNCPIYKLMRTVCWGEGIKIHKFAKTRKKMNRKENEVDTFGFHLFFIFKITFTVFSSSFREKLQIDIFSRFVHKVHVLKFTCTHFQVRSRVATYQVALKIAPLLYISLFKSLLTHSSLTFRSFL